MATPSLLPSALIGAVASARSMTLWPRWPPPGWRGGERQGGWSCSTIRCSGSGLAMGLGELLGDVGQTPSGLVEDALIVSLGAAVVGLAVRRL